MFGKYKGVKLDTVVLDADWAGVYASGKQSLKICRQLQITCDQVRAREEAIEAANKTDSQAHDDAMLAAYEAWNADGQPGMFTYPDYQPIYATKAEAKQGAREAEAQRAADYAHWVSIGRPGVFE